MPIAVARTLPFHLFLSAWSWNVDIYKEPVRLHCICTLRKLGNKVVMFLVIWLNICILIIFHRKAPHLYVPMFELVF